MTKGKRPTTPPRHRTDPSQTGFSFETGYKVELGQKTVTTLANTVVQLAKYLLGAVCVLAVLALFGFVAWVVYDPSLGTGGMVPQFGSDPGN